MLTFSRTEFFTKWSYRTCISWFLIKKNTHISISSHPNFDMYCTRILKLHQRTCLSLKIANLRMFTKNKILKVLIQVCIFILNIFRKFNTDTKKKKSIIKILMCKLCIILVMISGKTLHDSAKYETRTKIHFAIYLRSHTSRL